MTSWIDLLYMLVSLLVAGLLMYVMQKVETDRWSKTDPLWLQWMRRLAFVGTALVLLYSIQSTDWQLTSLLLVGASAIILTINAVALALRAPPNNKGRMRLHQAKSAYRHSYLVARLISYFSHTR